MTLNKLLSAAAALCLLAACESASDQDANANGNGFANGANGNGVNGSGSTAPGTQGDFEANVGDRVFFETDSSVIGGEAQAVLERQAAWLKQYPNTSVVLEGHADERGTREYNLALGERRANSAKNYLVSLGVSASRVSTTSYGKERPAVLGHDERAWGQNRRAVTVIAQ
jgi:peptidoglycan-associated lipoprotein